MEELQYFKRSFYLWESFSTIPSACSYSSRTLCLSPFFSHLAPWFYLKNGNPSFLFFFPFLFFIVIFFSLSTPWDPEWKNFHSLSLCWGQLLCPGFTINSLIAWAMRLWDAFLSPPGRWGMKGPGSSRGILLASPPTMWTSIQPPGTPEDKHLCTCPSQSPSHLGSWGFSSLWVSPANSYVHGGGSLYGRPIGSLSAPLFYMMRKPNSRDKVMTYPRWHTWWWGVHVRRSLNSYPACISYNLTQLKTQCP